MKDNYLDNILNTVTITSNLKKTFLPKKLKIIKKKYSRTIMFPYVMTLKLKISSISGAKILTEKSLQMPQQMH